jgi:2-haloacid dehalogenase
MPRVCVFDVNETLLDVAALDPFFARHFGEAGARREWFEQLIQSALTSTVTGMYADFGTIAGAALKMVAARRSVTLPPEAPRELAGGVRTLPAHTDVGAALERLRGAGMRLATLTNSTLEVAEAQMIHTGLRGSFERVFSADAVRRLKPAAEPYRFAAEQLGVETRDCWLIAAHAWDVAGAMRAGCAGAFVARPGKVPDPLYPAPQVTGATLPEVAERIIAWEEATRERTES